MRKILFIALAGTLILSCNSNTDTATDTNSNNPTPDAPRAISYSIVNTYPHDTSSFTQGLILHNGQMYEGTGEYGRSHLLKVNLADGKIQQKIPLAEKFFGEGITVLNDTLYQLTWKEKAVFAYTLPTLKKVREFTIDTEGWGLTTDGKELIVSDGSSNLYYYNPSTFQLLRTQSVTESGNLSFNLNELEYIDGFIYANQWQAPYIFKIDPGSGAIIGKIDLGEVWRRVKAKDPLADVPNGIAYDSSSGKTYITGKRWPELYEIQLSK